uniref:DUF6457 domain-containing protein n=1 Tax=Nocardioides sp. TaxID=35761 RepID=UPI002B26D986
EWPRLARLTPVNLHDWIDELCDVLDLDTEVDEGLVNDLSDLAYDNVDHAAGAVTAYLLGYAAGAGGAGPEAVEQLAAKAQELAERWDKPVLAEPGEPADTGGSLDDEGVELGFDVAAEDEEEEEE